jgi:hypothetical protein
MDHHCSFTGNCVGHGNHRIFLLFLAVHLLMLLYALVLAAAVIRGDAIRAGVHKRIAQPGMLRWLGAGVASPTARTDAPHRRVY